MADDVNIQQYIEENAHKIIVPYHGGQEVPLSALTESEREAAKQRMIETYNKTGNLPKLYLTY